MGKCKYSDLEIKGAYVMFELDFLKNVFDFIRIVNPKNKEVLKMYGSEEYHILTHNKCYGIWTKNKVCENCISLRAIEDKKTIVKFEVEAGKVMLVISSPYVYEGMESAIELIKDVTENNIFDTMEEFKNVDYAGIIDALNKAVVTDELTKLYNKRYVLEYLPYDIKQCIASNKSIAIVMADIDHFKKINDTYGHVAGDEILRELGKILKKQTRSEEDWVARYGGEEFLIALKNMNLKELEMACNRIRELIEKTIFEVGEDKIQFTLSMGGALVTENNYEDINEIIENADQSLYKAKKTGRNKCIVKKFKEER